MKHEGDWWLGGFLVAFIAGMALTLFYTWVLVPQAPHTTPAQLNPADWTKPKNDYLVWKMQK